MRSFYAIILLGACITGLCPLLAHATGNVLVPSTNSSGSSGTTNLGLVPETASPPAPTNNAPQTPQLPTMQNAADVPLTPTQPTPALPYTPMPQSSANQIPSALAPAIFQTRIIKIPNYPATPEIAQGINLPHSIGIDIDPNWNPSGMKRISDQLGIPMDKVPSTCQISVSGTIMTDKGFTSFDSIMSAHATGKYDGKISQLIIITRAFCKTSFPVPSNKGPIMRVGDYYLASLGTGICRLPDTKTAPAKIVITDHGDNSLACQVQ